MGILQLPKRLHPDFALDGRQPQSQFVMDYSNPLTTGASLLVDSSGYDFVSGVQGDLVNGAALGIGRHGRSAFLGNDATADTTIPEAIDFPNFSFNETQFSITFISQWTGPAAAFNRLFSAKDSFTDTKGFECQTSTDADAFVMTGASNKFWQPTIATSWAFGGDVFILTAQWDGTSSKVYLNGDLVASQTAAAIDAAGATTGGIRVGAVLVANDRAFEGHMSYVYIKKGVLTDREARSLHQDPYQIVKPAVPQLYFVPTAAVAGRIMSSLASHGGLAGYGGIAGKGGGLAG